MPGLGGTAKFLQVFDSNDRGDIVFVGFATDDHALYRWSPSTGLSLLSAVNAPAPGVAATLLDGMWSAGIDNQGQVMAHWFLRDDPNGVQTRESISEAVWSDFGNEVMPIAYAGMDAPGVDDGTRFGHFGSTAPTVTNSGHTFLFSAQGMWRYHHQDGLTLVANVGDELVPNYRLASEPVGVHDDSGRSVFSVLLTQKSNPAVEARGILAIDRSGTARLVASKDAPAPGLPEGAYFSYSFEQIRPNATGEMVFLAPFLSPGVEVQEQHGVWRETASGDLELLLQTGKSLPILAGSMADRLDPLMLTDSGVTLGLARLTVPQTGSTPLADGPAALGRQDDTPIESPKPFLWTMDRSSEFNILAMAGDQAPGLAPGIFYSDFERTAVINELGQVLFFADLDGPGVNATNDQALYSIDSQGNPSMLLRKGERLEISPGDFRTIQVITNNVQSDNTLTDAYLTDSGMMPLNVRFTDRSEVQFLLRLHTVPEPSPAAMALIAVAALLSYRTVSTGRP